MTEVYKTIFDFPDYKISNLGNIKNKKTNRILKPVINVQGYYIIDLRVNGSRFTKKLHRLIADAFIENPENKPYIDHINNDKQNNNINNLRWATASENNMNKSIQSNNTNGYKGVTFDKKNKQMASTN